MEKIIIKEDEVPDILEKELPEMNMELEQTPGGINIYKALQAFASQNDVPRLEIYTNLTLALQSQRNS